MDKTLTYSYDQLSRVKNAKYYAGTTPTGTPADEYVYAFDVAGNRLSESHSVNGGTPAVTNYGYNSANRLTNAGYTYDANGNLTDDGVSEYTWDRANRLTSVGDSTNGFTNYAYDGLGNRISKSIGATITEYLVDMQPSLAVILREKIGSDNTHYVHGMRGIQSQVANLAWTEALSDGLGSVRGWVNSSQAFTDTNTFDPYGVPDSAVNGFGFTGEMTDDNGLVYLRARYYDPNAGVFASLDPFEGVHNRPMSVNGYSWVEGNPINRVDPFGLVYLTFDDGPHDNDRQILDILRTYNAKATFFFHGSEITSDKEDIVWRVASEGHRLGNHSWQHQNLSSVCVDELVNSIVSTNDAIVKALQEKLDDGLSTNLSSTTLFYIRSVIAYGTGLFRAPGGDLWRLQEDFLACRAPRYLLENSGYVAYDLAPLFFEFDLANCDNQLFPHDTYRWDVDPQDWYLQLQINANQIEVDDAEETLFNRIFNGWTRYVGPGNILPLWHKGITSNDDNILLHSNSELTVRTLPWILQAILDRGYTFDLLNPSWMNSAVLFG